MKLRDIINNKTIYRGGLPLDKTKVNKDGVSFTTDIAIAKYWASSRTGGKVYTYTLKDTANILTIPPHQKLNDHQDKERVVRHALAKGYDGVDLSAHFNEREIRMFNLDVVVPNIN